MQTIFSQTHSKRAYRSLLDYRYLPVLPIAEEYTPT